MKIEASTAGAEVLETSLSNTGFTEDANATEEAEVVPSTETESSQSEQTTEAEGTEESPDESSEATEEEASAEGDESSEAEESEAEPQGYDILLPATQQKSYPEELYQLAAKKFGIDESLLANKSVKDLLKGKIDSDIEVRNLRERDEEESSEEETEEEESPAAETETGTRVTPQQQVEATYRFLREGSDGKPIITAEGAKMYTDATLAAYTELTEAIESKDSKKVAAAEMKYAESQAMFLTNGMATILPHLLPYMLRGLPENIWDGIVGAKLEHREEEKEVHRVARDFLKKDPRYATDMDRLIKSGQVFEFVRDNPEVMEKQFRDAKGKPIRDAVQLNVARYRYVINQLRGQNYQPPADLVKKGMKAGERHATEMAQKKAAGKVTPGRTRGVFGGQGGRYEDKAWADRMKRASDDSNPLGAFLDSVKP